MFVLRRQKELEDCKWTPRDGYLHYIETRTFAKTVKAITSTTFREGSLNDTEVTDWLNYKGRFAWPSDSALGSQCSNNRLLLCERFNFQTLNIGMSMGSFLAVEEAFDLPIETLPTFKFDGGAHSHHIRHASDGTHDIEKLYVTVKVPQMWQIANYGLSLTHCFKTHCTLAFMCSRNMLENDSWEMYMRGIKRPTHLNPHGPRISRLLQASLADWGEPLLLPILLFEDHVYNADNFKRFDINPRVNALERRLGALEAGRSFNMSELLDLQDLFGNMGAESRFKLLTDINTTTTNVVTFLGVMRWDKRYSAFLKGVAAELERLKNNSSSDRSAEGREEPILMDSVETMATLMESILEHAEVFKARLDIQLSVLYNLAAQSDSHINSTIAATTGLDSAAMKALAFVTTVFLPPTFIATLFSMSMFDWQAAGSSDEKKIVSRNFWVYWVVSVPVTILVLIGYRAWWRWEKSLYSQRYPHVKLYEPGVGSAIAMELGRMIKRRGQAGGKEDVA